MLPALAWAGKVRYPDVVPRPLVFPRDHGAHPDFRTEWWYVTGWLENSLGFQITFFRARPENESANPSTFTPRRHSSCLKMPWLRPALSGVGTRLDRFGN